MNFFGRRQQPAPSRKAAQATSSGGTSTGSTIASLKQNIETMGKRQKLLEQKVAAEHNKALDFKKKGNKKAALLCLKRKKMYEKEAEKVSAVSFKIEQQIITLEASQSNVDAVNTQRMFKSEMEKISKQMNPDKVADLQDDIQEQMDKQEEVNEILTQSMAGQDDEDDLLEELDELMNEDEEEVDMSTLNIGESANTGIYELPATPFEEVPKGTIGQSTQDEEAAALRELEAEMAA